MGRVFEKRSYIMAFDKEEYEITTEYADLEHLLGEIEWEIVEYDGDTNDEFVILHDTTVWQIMVVLRTLMAIKNAQIDTKTPQEIRYEAEQRGIG